MNELETLKEKIKQLESSIAYSKGMIKGVQKYAQKNKLAIDKLKSELDHKIGELDKYKEMLNGSD